MKHSFKGLLIEFFTDQQRATGRNTVTVISFLFFPLLNMHGTLSKEWGSARTQHKMKYSDGLGSAGVSIVIFEYSVRF